MEIYHLSGEAGERWMGWFKVTPVNLVMNLKTALLGVGCIEKELEFRN